MPVVLRSLVQIDPHGGTFDGTLIGGNGRQFVAQTDTFSSTCRSGRKALTVSLAWPDNVDTEVIGWLIDPDGTLLGSDSSLRRPEHAARTRTASRRTRSHRSRAAGSSSATVTTPAGGTVLSSPYHGVISFDQPAIQRDRPAGRDKVAAGQPVTATVTVTNTGPGTADVFADPRLGGYESDSLFPLSSPDVQLPGTNVPSFLVPTQTDAVVGAAQGTAPIVLEIGYGELGEGDPDLLGVSQGTGAAAVFSGPPELSNGTWFLAPALRGPFDAAASGSATVGMLAHTKAFDRSATRLPVTCGGSSSTPTRPTTRRSRSARASPG